MRESVRCLVVLSALLLPVTVWQPSAAATTRPVVSTHISFTGFDEGVRAGARISVVQTCPAGSRLDRAATRAFAAVFDEEPQTTVRRTGRELAPTRMVTRYRVLRAAAVPQDDGFGLVNAAVCTGSTRTGATTFAGRASTDVRVSGPSAVGAQLFSVTYPAVTDRPPSAETAPDSDLPYLTVVRALGVRTAPGAVAGGVRATQSADDDGGSGTVLTTGTIRRAAPAGQFVSMRSAYAFTADLTQRIVVEQAPEQLVVESSTGACAVAPEQVPAGEREVVLVALDGPASVVVRDSRGDVVLERTALRQEEVPGEDSDHPVWGVAEPAVVVLAEGEHTVECHLDGGGGGTATFQVTAEQAAQHGG